MKISFFFTAIVLFPLCITAQDCDVPHYRVLMREADKAALEGTYDLAINKLQSAKVCQPDSEAVVNRRVVEVFREVNKQRKEAVLQRSLAENRAKEIQRQKDVSDKSARSNRLAALALQRVKTDYTLGWHLACLAYLASFDSVQGSSTEPGVCGILHDIVSDKDAFFHKLLSNDTIITYKEIFSPDGKYILACCSDKKARMWDREGHLLVTFSGHKDLVHNAVFSDDGEFVLTSSGDNTARLWNKNGQLLKILGESAEENTGDQEEENTVDQEEENTVDQEEESTGDQEEESAEPEEVRLPCSAWGLNAGHNANFSTDGNYILTWNAGRLPKLWDKNGLLIKQLNADENALNIEYVVFFGEKVIILKSFIHGSMWAWDMSGQLIKDLSDIHYKLLTISPDENLFLTCCDEKNKASLWNKTGELVKTFSGHSGELTGAEFSPDGLSILTYSEQDSLADIWSNSGELIKTLRGHSGNITNAQFTLGGLNILTCSKDSTARIWYKNGQPINILKQHHGEVLSATYSPDGQDFFTVSTDGKIILWDKFGKYIEELNGTHNNMESAEFSPDGQYILTLSDNSMSLWARCCGQILNRINYEGKIKSGYDNKIKSGRFSPNSRYFLTYKAAGEADAVNLWNETGQPINTFTENNVIPYTMEFSPDGNAILSNGAINDNNGEILRLFDVDKKIDNDATLFHQPPASWPSNDAGLLSNNSKLSPSVSPDEHYIMIRYNDLAEIWDIDGNLFQIFGKKGLDMDGAIFSTINTNAPSQEPLILTWNGFKATLWEITGVAIRTLDLHEKRINQALFSPDGQYIFTCSDDKTTRIWDRNGLPLKVLEGHKGPVTGILISPDGQKLLTWSTDGTARLWDKNEQLIRILEGHNNAILGGLFSFDGESLLTWSKDSTIRVWDKNGFAITSIKKKEGVFTTVLFSPDSQYILASTSDSTVQLFRRDGTQIKTLNENDGVVYAPAFSTDGQSILTLGNGGVLQIRDKFGALLKTPEKPKGTIIGAAFSLDNQYILTWGEGGDLQILSRSGIPIRTLTGHKGGVKGTSFFHNGKYILSWGEDTTTRLWDTFPNYIQRHWSL